MNAASAGATVNVCPGIYPEQVTIAKSLTLLGVSKGSSDNIVIVPPPGGLLQNASDPAPGATNPKIAAQIFAHGPATVTLKNIIIAAPITGSARLCCSVARGHLLSECSRKHNRRRCY